MRLCAAVTELFDRLDSSNSPMFGQGDSIAFVTWLIFPEMDLSQHHSGEGVVCYFENYSVCEFYEMLINSHTEISRFCLFCFLVFSLLRNSNSCNSGVTRSYTY